MISFWCIWYLYIIDCYKWLKQNDKKYVTDNWSTNLPFTTILFKMSQFKSFTAHNPIFQLFVIIIFLFFKHGWRLTRAIKLFFDGRYAMKLLKMRSSNPIIIHFLVAFQPLCSSQFNVHYLIYSRNPCTRNFHNDWLKIRKEARHSFAPTKPFALPR